MDKDKNGILTDKEQKNLKRVVKRNRLKLSGVKKCMRSFLTEMCDSNRDGAVDSAEFAKCVLLKVVDRIMVCLFRRLTLL